LYPGAAQVATAAIGAYAGNKASNDAYKGLKKTLTADTRRVRLTEEGKLHAASYESSNFAFLAVAAVMLILALVVIQK